MYTTCVYAGENVVNQGSNVASKQFKIEIGDINEFYKNVQIVAEKNKKQEILYNKMVEVFKKNYIESEIINNRMISYKIVVQKNISKENIRKFFEEVKPELMLEVGLENTDYAFNYAFDLLVEALTFSMCTYKKISEMYVEIKDGIAFCEKLIKDYTLFQDFIIAVNWQLRICGINLYTSLLHNFENIYAHIKNFSQEYSLSFQYYHYNEFSCERIDQKIMDEIAIVFLDYYKKNIIKGNIGFLQIEEFESLVRYCKKHLQPYKDIHYIAITIAFNAIVIKRGRLAKLHYIAKSSYYKDAIRTPIEIKLSIIQEKFLESLKEKDEVENNIKLKYEMIFDSQHMHTNDTKMNICMLSFQLLNNITRLTDFTNKYIDLFTKSIKENHKRAVIDYFDALIRQIEDKQILANINQEELEQDKETLINSMDTIESPSSILQEMKTNEKIEAYKNKIQIIQYDNEYHKIFDKIKYYNDMTQSPSIKINNIKEKTVEIYKSIIGLDFFDKISKIIILQEKIEKEIDEIVYKKDKAFFKVENMINGTSLTYEGSKHEQAQNQNEDQMTMQEKKIIFEEIITHENRNKFYESNKVTFESIISNTIELTGMIIEAENDAYTLIEIIKKYDEI